MHRDAAHDGQDFGLIIMDLFMVTIKGLCEVCRSYVMNNEYRKKIEKKKKKKRNLGYGSS